MIKKNIKSSTITLMLRVYTNDAKRTTAKDLFYRWGSNIFWKARRRGLDQVCLKLIYTSRAIFSSESWSFERFNKDRKLIWSKLKIRKF